MKNVRLWLMAVAVMAATSGILTAGEKAAAPAKPKRRRPVRAARRVPGKAVPAAKRILIPKNDSEYYQALAEIHSRYQILDDAEKCYLMAIEKEKDPENAVRLQSSLAKLYITLNRESDAVGLLEIAARTTANKAAQVKALFELARILEKSKKTEKAIDAYKAISAAADRPRDKHTARAALLRLYQRSGKLDQAIQDYEKKVAETPDDEEALYILSEVYDRLKPDPEKATAIIERLQAKTPDDRQLQDRLAIAYLKHEQPEKAVELFKRSLERKPDEKSHYFGRSAETYRRAGNKEEALEWARKLVETDEPTAEAHDRLARFYAVMAMNKEAVGELQKAIELAKTPHERHRFMLMCGDAMSRFGEIESARQLFEQVLHESKDDRYKRFAQKMLSKLQSKPQLDKIAPLPGRPRPKVTPVPKRPRKPEPAPVAPKPETEKPK